MTLLNHLFGDDTDAVAVVCYGSSAYGNVMIADQMNFSSLSYFSRYCTKHLGQSPSEYRRSLQPRG